MENLPTVSSNGTNLTDDYDLDESHPTIEYSFQAYLRLSFLLTVFFVGAPINSYVFFNVVNRIRIRTSRILLLQLQLSISDLLFVYVYTVSELAWALTVSFKGGNIGCKTLKFVHLLSFYLSSNTIVCISVDRLLSIIYPMKGGAKKGVKLSIGVAWILATICSLPQLCIWQTYPFGSDYQQCMTTFKVQQILNPTLFESVGKHQRYTYTIFNLLTVFWLPFAIVVICYLLILREIILNYRKQDKLERENNYYSILSAIRMRIYNKFKQRKPSRQTPIVKQGRRRQKRQWHSADSPTAQLEMKSQNKIINHQLKRKSICVVLVGKAWNGQVNVVVPSSSSDHSIEGEKIQLDNELNLKFEKPMSVNLNSNTSTTVGPPVIYSVLYPCSIKRSVQPRRTPAKAMKMTAFIVLAYVVCWLPYNIISLMALLGTHSRQYMEALEWLYTLALLNSIVNPFIYYKFFILKTQSIIHRLIS